ncbi:MAG: fructose-bisphosphatase class II, partial [Planctomycetes bacterium]|nr:fructose-bisphosphatase class II [Planctomycetota bacterium]
GIDQYINNIQVISWLSEGSKDRHARLPEKLSLTRPRPLQSIAHAVSDSLECEAQLACARRSRASTVILGLAPEGSMPKVNSSTYSKYLALPPGSPVGPGKIGLDTHPRDIIRLLCETFGRSPSEIVVTILHRTWTADLASKFSAAGAKVKHIMAGDFHALVDAGMPVVPDAPVGIAAGYGGKPESFLAAFFHKWSGGTILMQEVPTDVELGTDRVGTFVFDKESMIRSDDCLLAVAGITEADKLLVPIPSDRYLVPGVRSSRASRTCWVTVMVVSPTFEQPRHYVVEYKSGSPSQPTLLSPDESLDEHLLSRYISLGNEIETRLTETGAEDREYFQWWRGSFVPGLEGLSERELIDLLKSLRGRISRHEEVTDGDPSDYRVYWGSAK